MARWTAARCRTQYRNAAGVGAPPGELAAVRRCAGPASVGADPRGWPRLGTDPARPRSRGRLADSFIEEEHRQRGAIDARARAGSNPPISQRKPAGAIAMTQGAVPKLDF